MKIPHLPNFLPSAHSKINKAPLGQASINAFRYWFNACEHFLVGMAMLQSIQHAYYRKQSRSRTSPHHALSSKHQPLNQRLFDRARIELQNSQEFLERQVDIYLNTLQIIPVDWASHLQVWRERSWADHYGPTQIHRDMEWLLESIEAACVQLLHHAALAYPSMMAVLGVDVADLYQIDLPNTVGKSRKILQTRMAKRHIHGAMIRKLQPYFADYYIQPGWRFWIHRQATTVANSPVVSADQEMLHIESMYLVAKEAAVELYTFYHQIESVWKLSVKK